MTDAFQGNAFQCNAFQVTCHHVESTLQVDQGSSNQSMLIWRGPTLGWVRTYIEPQLVVTEGGHWVLGVNCCVVLVDVADYVYVALPRVRDWVKEPHLVPFTAFDNSIWVKDVGYHAGAFPISVNSEFGEPIDGLNTITLINDGEFARFYPLSDLSGWYVGQ